MKDKEANYIKLISRVISAPLPRRSNRVKLVSLQKDNGKFWKKLCQGSQRFQTGQNIQLDNINGGRMIMLIPVLLKSANFEKSRDRKIKTKSQYPKPEKRARNTVQQAKFEAQRNTSADVSRRVSRSEPFIIVKSVIKSKKDILENSE